MNYDVWGSWSSAVEPNSTLNDAPANQEGSAVSAVEAAADASQPDHTRCSFLWSTLQYPAFQCIREWVPLNSLHTQCSILLINHLAMHGMTPVVLILVGLPDGTFGLWALIDGEFLTAEGGPSARYLLP